MANADSWMNNPALNNIDPVKLQILSSLASEAGKKSPNEMMPFFMSAMNQTAEKGVNFTQPERELLINILMQNLPPEDKKKAETILRMTSAFQKK